MALELCIQFQNIVAFPGEFAITGSQVLIGIKKI